MITIKKFIFNFIQVNTFVLNDETKECIIIDPGCYSIAEKSQLMDYINANNLQPIAIVFTHPHIDHVVGAKFVKENFKIPIFAHEKSDSILSQTQTYALTFGFENIENIVPDKYLKHGDLLNFGKNNLSVLYTPGHADGSICLYNKEDGFVITGDVLFAQSIGRSDLPTGNHNVLIESIKTHLMTLPDNTDVYPGHGPKTNIGFERKNNPYL